MSTTRLFGTIGAGYTGAVREAVARVCEACVRALVCVWESVRACARVRVRDVF